MTQLLHLCPADYQSLQQSIARDYPFDMAHAHHPDMLESYAHPSRSYHDLRHIRQLLEVMAAYLQATGQHTRSAWNLKDWLIKAIWIHDMVQDDSGESEARSFALAYAQLAPHWPAEALSLLETHVRPLVMATAHFAQNDTLSIAEQTMADIDLSPLAASPDVFAHNSAMVREEFLHVPAKVYGSARANILQLFLKRARIYYLDWFYERYEAPARANLRREINRLQMEQLNADCKSLWLSCWSPYRLPRFRS